MEGNQKEADASFFVLKTKSKVTKRNMKQKRHWQSIGINYFDRAFTFKTCIKSVKSREKIKEKIFKKRLKKVKKGLDEGKTK